jgi:hypothetical protein
LAAHRSLTTTSIAFFKELLSPLETSLREVEVAAFVKLSLMGFFGTSNQGTQRKGR